MTITAIGALSPDTGTVPVFPFSMFGRAPRLRLPHSRPGPHAGRRSRILAAADPGPWLHRPVLERGYRSIVSQLSRHG